MTAAAIDRAVSELVQTRVFKGDTIISLPVIMVTGALVSVAVRQDDAGTFTVSDRGFAAWETSSAERDELFIANAKRACWSYGVEFEKAEFLFRGIAENKLSGAITTMGEIVRDVVAQTLPDTAA